jgi:predicted dinucleotide-binding enzyme
MRCQKYCIPALVFAQSWTIAIQLLARQLLDARIVKAFNTVYWETPVSGTDLTPQQAAAVLAEE